MGTVVQIIKFPNVKVKNKFERIIEEKAEEGKTESYGQIVLNLNLPERRNPVKIPLKIRFTRPPRQSRLIDEEDMLSCIYGIELDVPKRIEHMDGVWDIKEKKVVEYISYAVSPLETYSLLVGDSKEGVNGALNALRQLGMPIPVKMQIAFRGGVRFIELMKRLGSIGWIYVNRIPDYHVKGASMHGIRLEEAEILRDLISRGGEVTAIVVYNESKGLSIILSGKGTIYSRQNLRGEDIAREVKGILELFQEYNLIRVVI
mgnify:CR=1 FL=1